MSESPSNPPRRHPLVAWLILLILLLALAAVVAVMSRALIEAKHVVEPYILPQAGSTTGGIPY
jgi:hypothetical protein